MCGSTCKNGWAPPRRIDYLPVLSVERVSLKAGAAVLRPNGESRRQFSGISSDRERQIDRKPPVPSPFGWRPPRPYVPAPRAAARWFWGRPRVVAPLSSGSPPPSVAGVFGFQGGQTENPAADCPPSDQRQKPRVSVARDEEGVSDDGRQDGAGQGEVDQALRYPQDKIARSLNTRPRKTLGFIAPCEAFAEAVASTP